MGDCGFFWVNTKGCGMVGKKEGKENEKCSTMPDVLIKGYKILRTVSVGQDFSIAEVEHKQSGIPDCLCGSHRLIHYDSYRRYIKHVSENGAIYHLKVKCKRYKCLDCGRVFRERLEGVRPYARHSERLGQHQFRRRDGKRQNLWNSVNFLVFDFIVLLRPHSATDWTI